MADADEPIGLTEAALGPGIVHTPQTPIAVYAWVPYPDGYRRAKGACATAWNDRAVRVRWRGSAREVHELWIWAKAVTRRGKVIEGPLATDRPELIAWRGVR